MAPKPPIRIKDAPRGLRQRQRADGTWRVWWEPWTEARAAGYKAVDLDPGRPTWSIGIARKQAQDAARTLAGGGKMTRGSARTMSALIDNYQRSAAFRDLAPKTQADYRARMKVIGAKWGADPVTGFTKPVMRTWYETLLDKSGEWQAVALMRIMSLLFSHAELRGWRAEDSNPCRRLKMATPKPRSRSGTWAELDALLQAARDLAWPNMECAIAMAAMQGQRQTDIRTARADGFRQVQRGRKSLLVWILERSKRDNLGTMPVHDEVAPLIRARLMRNEPHPSGLLLVDDVTGQPWSEATFQARWRRVRAAAAKTHPSLMTLQFRDLRRTFGVFARAGGATVDDVGNVLGNSVAVDPTLEETYLPASFETTARAVAAVKRPKVSQKKTG